MKFEKGQIPWNKNKKNVQKPYWLGKKRSKEDRDKMSKARKIFLSNPENHWNWQGGISPENDRIRHSLEWQIWRNEVYKRDFWKCRLCESKKQIVAHHIKLFSQYPELRFSTDNGMTLCRSCHLIIHKKNNA